MMSLPAAFSSLALLVMASVGDGLMLLTRLESCNSLVGYPCYLWLINGLIVSLSLICSAQN